ncbi:MULTISPECIES: peptide-methionine (S)-S-oxide reductase MsrA [unclassified Haladaptatus]|uniref:peptide-methionine (S)-S-oxide reductase MsrA n=1 Tax=unclassified Haladaptatus TaxID=2622732 RepID=UPI0023E837C7|nr:MULTISPECIES: peptide-methionine (S)-S-oxide reductase MsrA [unclassified Haladaptatus]
MTQSLATATFAGGCFWCTEAAFKELKGVTEVTSGYTGGETENPTYEEVCSGNTGHAEAIQVTYDTDQLSYIDLLRVFFTVHDPTTLNRQGNDVGTQYRSAIYYHDESQRERAEAVIDEIEASGTYDSPVVTEVEPLGTWYDAEEYHQDFYEKNPSQGYCSVTIPPKLDKVRKQFGELVKS